MTRPCWTLPLRQRSGPSSASVTDMRDPNLAPHCAAAETIWHHANVCQNGCHRHSSLWFLCDVTNMCRVCETSRERLTCILGSRREIDPGSTAGAALCNTSFGQDKSGIRWTYRHSIVHDWLYLPCPRGASHPVSVTCATDWHFLSHPQMMACALASRQHSKFITVSPDEDCFKPMALQVPGSPLRPCGSASGFSGLCRSTCWCKTGRNCISRATFESYLTP